MKPNTIFIVLLLFVSCAFFFSCNENSCDSEKEVVEKTVVLNSSAKITDVLISSKLPDGNTPEFIAIYGPIELIDHTSIYYWTFSGVQHESQAIFKFDVSDIKPNSSIKSAVLTLKGMDNNDLNPSEDVNIYKITQSWDINTICWNNPPIFNSSEPLFVAKTAMNSTYDLTPYIQYWVNNPSANYGMIMQLAQRSLYHAFDFWSSENADATLRPELVIKYEEE